MHSNLLKILFVTIVVWTDPPIQAVAYGHTFSAVYRDYLEKLLDIIDNQTDACQNFFQHACGGGGFAKGRIQKEDTVYDGAVPPFLYNKQDYFNHFVSSKALFRTKPAQLLRDLYDLCTKAFALYGNNNNKMRHRWYRLLDEIPFLKKDRPFLIKWPFLAHRWQGYQGKLFLNWPELLAELSAHDFKTFVNVFFVESTIYLRAEQDFMCPPLSDIIRNLKMLLGRRHEQVAHIIANELWTFCQDLKAINIRNDPLKETQKSHINELLNQDVWQQYFQQFFISLNLTLVDIRKARKVIVGAPILNEILSVLNTTEERIIYNFIIYSTIQQLQITDCFSIIEHFEDDIVLPEYWIWHIFESHLQRPVALASYLWHIAKFQRRRRHELMSEDWDRFLHNKIERKDFNIERAIKTYGQDLLDAENRYGSYQDIPTSTTFFPLWLQMKRKQKYSSFLKPYLDKEDVNHAYYFFKEFLHFTILVLYRPIVHYYASQGREMWHQAQFLYTQDSFFTFDDCMKQQQSSISFQNNSGDFLDTSSSEHIQNIYEFYTTFSISREDYKFWLQGEHFDIAEDFLLEYFQLDRERIIFYAIAQQYCSRNDAFFGAVINRSFMNMWEFQEIFNCSTDAIMNPQMKCIIDGKWRK